MSFENFHAVLALLNAEGMRPDDCFGIEIDSEEVFTMLQSVPGRAQLARITGWHVGAVDWKMFDAQLSALARCRSRALCCMDTDYPEAFREVAHPPPLVFYTGDASLLRRRGIAVVGTRKPSPGGVAFARSLARALALNDVVVISGLARGIDTAAHRGALAAPSMTVAVIGTGIDVPYPPENAELMVEIARNGCVVSEQFMGMHADRHVFPRRNRLISALSHAVVVVEGGLKSGALITARWALEQGRDVGAVPGFPGDFRSAGPNQLLRQGAFVVESMADVFHAVPRLAHLIGTAVGRGGGVGMSPAPDGEASVVFDAMSTAPTHPDDIASATGLAIEKVLGAVVELELAGLVARDDDGRFARTGR